ncbi:MAG: DUF167 domain-containing protein [Methanoregula sp.]|jgi:hypothetical protein|uniref:DUF167 domain-containing protein n=1 Tax=Methanoregula sp. TaxID=2052170 RepID=UPI0025FFAD88|nr:DUF167 domain-containing protein [Methanoregula sp.]MCK9630783.1 DUF167 domain-containing protein [Methanoregula sp.]
MPGIADALLEDHNGTVIAIEVTAGGKKEAFPAGYNEWRKMVGCRVSAPALEGRANRAVIELVARTLGRSTASVSILSGATSSQKKILVTGMSLDDVLIKLEGSGK